jgi:signal transduction histidine kinase
MLNYGLKPAIESLADNLMERTRDTVDIEVNIEADDTRYQVNNIEEHIFHMVQECCGNAVRHAQAKKIQISGRLIAEEISLTITDDGVGFEIKDGLDVETLRKHRHFGLAGILKRATLIGAKVAFSSELRNGTHVQISLKPDRHLTD